MPDRPETGISRTLIQEARRRLHFLQVRRRRLREEVDTSRRLVAEAVALLANPRMLSD